jgi:hypothetical protein
VIFSTQKAEEKVCRFSKKNLIFVGGCGKKIKK